LPAAPQTFGSRGLSDRRIKSGRPASEEFEKLASRPLTGNITGQIPFKI
jgi:hypothetical protein